MKCAQRGAIREHFWKIENSLTVETSIEDFWFAFFVRVKAEKLNVWVWFPLKKEWILILKENLQTFNCWENIMNVKSWITKSAGDNAPSAVFMTENISILAPPLRLCSTSTYRCSWPWCRSCSSSRSSSRSCSRWCGRNSNPRKKFIKRLEFLELSRHRSSFSTWDPILRLFCLVSIDCLKIVPLIAKS